MGPDYTVHTVMWLGVDPDYAVHTVTWLGMGPDYAVHTVTWLGVGPDYVVQCKYCIVARCRFTCTQTGIVSTWRCSCWVAWQHIY